MKNNHTRHPGASIEPIVNEMFQIFCHSHLTHQLVLVTTQTLASAYIPVQGANVSEYIGQHQRAGRRPRCQAGIERAHRPLAW